VTRVARALAGLVLAAGLAAWVAALAGCSARVGSRAAEWLQGDPERGRLALRRYGCGSCHTIPGVPGATSRVGPPLAGIADRSYIAGVLVNAPENMLRWIENPQAVDSLTAMPNMGVPDGDARDIASYLYRLR